MVRSVLFAGCIVVIAAGCGGASPPPAEPSLAPPAEAAPVASASGAPETAPAPAPNESAPPVAAPSLECTALGRFPESAYVPADDPTGVKKTVVPWMEDPLGERAPPKPKKGQKGKPKDDPHLAELRVSFRKCIDLARQLDGAQTAAISFEHKPKGGEHKMCVRLQRDDGRAEVNKDLTHCMLDAIRTWAQKAP